MSVKSACRTDDLESLLPGHGLTGNNRVTFCLPTTRELKMRIEKIATVFAPGA
jgi:hypothetical protein